MSWLRCASLFLLAVPWLAGCIPPRDAGQEVRTAVSDTVLDALMERLQESGRSFKSLQGLAKVQVVWQGKRSNFNQALQLEKPDRFRAETLNPFGFGTPLLLMAADGRDLAVMIPGDGTLLRGEASSKNLQRFIKLPLQLADLVHFLLYQVQVIPAQQRRGTLGPTGDYRLELYDGDDRQELLFSRDMQLLETTYFRAGNLVLTVRYDNFTEGGSPFPRFAHLSMPLQQAEAALTFSEFEMNLSLPADLFQLVTPPGYEERPFP